MQDQNKAPGLHVETWGCQMNVADSEAMLAAMQRQGYRLVSSPQEAKLILLNTCHIREKAKHKVLSRLGVLAPLKAQDPELRIAVAGCVAQAEGQKLLAQAPSIDILLGPGQLEKLPSLVAQSKEGQGPLMALGFPKKEETPPASSPQCDEHPSLLGKNRVSRFVNIQKGCDNFCSFCVVPFTRGREISLRPREILASCQSLLEGGAKEITLLGQNVNSYGQDLAESSQGEPFVDLLKEVSALKGLERLRFTTSNPHDLTAPLAQLFAQIPKLGAYYHLPVQSGSDAILARMRRKVTAQSYLEKLGWLRAARRDIWQLLYITSI